MSKKNRNADSLPAPVSEDTSFNPAELEEGSAGLDDTGFENSEPPEGFDIDAELVRGDGWAIKGEGYVIQGRLKGRQEFRGGDGKMRAFYSIILARKCHAVIGKGDDAEPGILEPGQIVNVDDSAALGQLESRAKDGGVYDVWIRYGAKEKLQGKPGQTFWPAEVKLRMVKPPASI